MAKKYNQWQYNDSLVAVATNDTVDGRLVFILILFLTEQTVINFTAEIELRLRHIPI